MKLLKLLFTLLLLCVLVVLTLSQYHIYQQQKKQDDIAILSRSAVLQKIQTLNRLETIGFNIDTVITTNREGTWFKLWQDKHKSLFIARGSVQAGVNLNKLQAQHITVDSTGNSTTIQLPPVEIFHVYLDNIDLYDSTTGLLARPIEREALASVQERAKADILSKACSAGILTMANDAAQKQIQALFMLANTSVVVKKAELGVCIEASTPQQPSQPQAQIQNQPHAELNSNSSLLMNYHNTES